MSQAALEICEVPRSIPDAAEPQAQPPAGSPRKCACGCPRYFQPERPWHKYATPGCRKRKWQSRAARRDAKERVLLAQGRIKSVRHRVTVQVGSIKAALQLVAKSNPTLLLALVQRSPEQPAERNA